HGRLDQDGAGDRFGHPQHQVEGDDRSRSRTADDRRGRVARLDQRSGVLALLLDGGAAVFLRCARGAPAAPVVDDRPGPGGQGLRDQPPLRPGGGGLVDEEHGRPAAELAPGELDAAGLEGGHRAGQRPRQIRPISGRAIERGLCWPASAVTRLIVPGTTTRLSCLAPSTACLAISSADIQTAPGVRSSTPPIPADSMNSVRTGPGQTAVTVTPDPRSSVRIASLKERTNALVAP